MNNIAFLQNINVFKEKIEEAQKEIGYDIQIDNFRVQITPTQNGYSMVARNMINGYDIMIAVNKSTTEVIVRILNISIKIDRSEKKLDNDLLIIYRDLMEVTGFKLFKEKLDNF